MNKNSLSLLKQNISYSVRKVLGNDKGVTLVELITTFALLGLFMVAATRVISYVMGIYYAAQGTSNGLQVTNMITNKIVGQIENAATINSFTPEGESTMRKGPIVYDGGDLDRLQFVDASGSIVTYSISGDGYLNINYAATMDYNATTGEGYAETNWYFDSNAYMGYRIVKFNIVNPGDEYPGNVIRMDITVNSPKYDEFDSSYYIKCFNIETDDSNECGIRF